VQIFTYVYAFFQTADGEELEFGIAADDNDRIRPGRITMFETKEQLALLRGLYEGVTLLIDDGLVELRVTSVKSPTEVMAVVVHGGVVKARKGVNVPDVMIDCSALPEKDIEDAEYLLQLEPPVEYISISFAQKASDLQELIDIMDRMNIPPERRPNICPKIEKPQVCVLSR
jgi:pyruvate kinase